MKTKHNLSVVNKILTTNIADRQLINKKLGIAAEFP